MPDSIEPGTRRRWPASSRLVADQTVGLGDHVPERRIAVETGRHLAERLARQPRSSRRSGLHRPQSSDPATGIEAVVAVRELDGRARGRRRLGVPVLAGGVAVQIEIGRLVVVDAVGRVGDEADLVILLDDLSSAVVPEPFDFVRVLVVVPSEVQDDHVVRPVEGRVRRTELDWLARRCRRVDARSRPSAVVKW